MTIQKIDWSDYLKEMRDRSSNATSSTSASSSSPKYDYRNAFESDFGRVCFSAASRRMHDKTQVIPLNCDDNVHSRLTHSIEVMSIAHSLAINICRNPDFISTYGVSEASELEKKISPILKTAGLIHDIGNPPFGHYGEEIIARYFEKKFQKEFHLTEEQKLDFTHFDGNAQGLRVITKLQYLNDLYGLNLTYATLGAYMKYPNSGEIKKGYIGTKKHGVFFSEKEILNKIISECKLNQNDKVKRHPLSFLVEAADTICYRSMDIEDGWNLGWYSFESMIDNIDKILKSLKINQDILSIIELTFPDPIPDRKKIVDFRVKLIQYFVTLATKNFLENLDHIDSGTYTHELLDNDPNKIEEALKRFNKKYIFIHRQIQYAECTGASVINGLLDILIGLYFNEDKSCREHAKNITSKSVLRTTIKEAHPNDDIESDYLFNFDVANLDSYSRLRIIVDFISGMTDQYAIKLYQRLSGQRL